MINHRLTQLEYHFKVIIIYYDKAKLKDHQQLKFQV